MAITTLQGTKWRIKDSPTLSNIGEKDVNFESNETSYSSMTINTNGITYDSTVAYAEVYSITTSVTNGTYTGATSITYGGTATVTISANTDYELPSTVTVSGATSSYDDTTGVITLTNPSGNVTISATCPAALPQLDAPENLLVSDTTASFDEVENAESYEFYVDDVSVGEYSTQTGYTLTLSLNEDSDGDDVYYKTISDSSGEASIYIEAGETQTIQNCTGICFSFDRGTCESITGTVSPVLAANDSIVDTQWYTLESDVTMTAYIIT